MKIRQKRRFSAVDDVIVLQVWDEKEGLWFDVPTAETGELDSELGDNYINIGIGEV